VKSFDNAPLPLPDLKALSALAPELASTFVSVAADIALVMDAHGVIQHVALGSDPIVGSTGQWLGRSWVDTVTGETRRKVELLLSEVQTGGVTRRREVNHPSLDTADVPVAYSAIRLGIDGPVLAVGRSLRAVAAIQQRFVQATLAMERDYWEQRQSESQVRTLYQLAHDAVLVVDANTLRVTQANEAAHALLSARPGDGLVGTEVATSVLHAERPGFHQLLATARATGRPGVMRAHATPALMGHAPTALVPVEVSALPLRSGTAMQLMVQLRHFSAEAESTEAARQRSAWVEALDDALVVTDSSGRVLTCNPAFLALCRVPEGASAQRRSLAELLGDPTHTVARLLLQARHDGLAHVEQAFIGHSAPAPATASPVAANAAGRVAGAAPLAVQVWAMLLAEGDQERIGLRLRKLQPAADAATGPVCQLSLGISHLADQVGLQALPQLLQQATLLAERHLISTALARSQSRIREASALLGIPVATLQQRMQHLGLSGAGLAADTPDQGPPPEAEPAP
jgi:transcriptional regulator PpsR